MTDFPDDLLAAQRDLTAVRATLSARLAALPPSAEPMPAWERPDGYWAGARTHPASPGWSEEERAEVAALRERERDLAGVIVTHELWASLPAEERMRARDALKHAHEAPAAAGAAGARG
ncbi:MULTISPECIES: hypothetical protein [Streptomyces]|uniref:Uncharacterized protein n=1 Tax=Streptomyces evansiae TaxID=3075535 RepID=A0ABU2R7H7_9ACTN|nr:MULTISPECIES: hypothetical protein [unclassified Streptomyces]MYQ60215.1 hypothetical protein [Streptomyces sp. SID4926]MYX24160.1 hypothetical protein [Streptomyces sp. SID8380]ASY37084.1 hypothetical protein CAC01_31130 [Streptomyces sp. CLI2509]MDT0412646.1 hypothetical protein [Streptomyces sp. DSM 41979]SCD40952.1 hypothetical protein GA0115252_10504 [Streptomyces sp. DfronAA-171]